MDPCEVIARMGKRFFVETWGCQMNELDSQRMAGQLAVQGMERTESAEEADVILLNSCSVREKAAQKSYSQLGRYRSLKENNSDLVIGFCGCVAQQEGEAALQRVKDLDFVVGTGRVGELGRIVERAQRGERVLATGFPQDRHYDMDTIARADSHKGMITIIEGCDKRCTFCIVPTTRGPERSRPLAEIVTEAERLVAEGFQEIELLGQTVNHWREPEDGRGSGRALDFADLLDRIAVIPGLARLRFITSYPRDFSSRMVASVARHANICPFVHLPVQSGSDKILKRMGRGYDVASYFALVDALRDARCGLALSTDIIVGFPGETEEDFRQTMNLVERVRYSQVFAFKYSPRPGTPALRLPDQEVPLAVADRRLQDLFALQTPIQRALNEALIGETHEVLVTGRSRQDGYRSGRTPCHRIVHFAAGDSVTAGTIVPVQIQHANDHSLLGELVVAPRRVRTARDVREDRSA